MQIRQACDKHTYHTGYLFSYVLVIGLAGINIGKCTCDSFLIGYNLTVFNTMTDILAKTFNWSKEEESIWPFSPLSYQHFMARFI